MLADLRHDLRTPLTVITGYAAALADGTATGDEAARAARTIGEEAARLERLVDELGAVERLRRGAEGLRPEPIDALELLRSSAERFRAAAAAAGVALSIVGDPGIDMDAAPPSAPEPAANSSPTAARWSGSWPTSSATLWPRRRHRAGTSGWRPLRARPRPEAPRVR